MELSVNFKLNGQAGFTLIETIIGGSLVIGIILFGMKQSEFLGKSNFNNKIDQDLVEFSENLQNILFSTEVCIENFEGKNIDHDYTNIRDASQNPLYTEEDEIIPHTVKIEEIKTVVVDDLIYLDIKLNKSHPNARTPIIHKRFAILAELDASNNIQNCFSLVQSASDTVQYLVAQELCSQLYGEGTPEFELNFDASAGTCNINGLSALNNTDCQPGQAITQVSFDQNTNSYNISCSSNINSAVCPQSWIQSVSSDGTFSCVDISTIVNSTTTSFISGSQCALEVINNQIQLNCSAAGTGVCTDLPISGQCGPNIISGLDYSSCNTVYCGCLPAPQNEACVTTNQACLDLGGCL